MSRHQSKSADRAGLQTDETGELGESNVATIELSSRALMILGGAAAALAAWLCGAWLTDHTEAMLKGVEDLAVAWASVVIRGPMAETLLTQSHVGVYARETMVAVGGIGGLFGLFSGIVGGMHGRRVGSILTAGATGVLLGVVISATVAVLAVPISQGLLLRTPDARIAMTVRTLLYATVGTSGALAFGLGARSDRRSLTIVLMAGLMGGGAGAMLFVFIQAVFFPFESEYTPLSRSGGLSLLTAYLGAAFIPAACCAAVMKLPAQVEVGSDRRGEAAMPQLTTPVSRQGKRHDGSENHGHKAL